MVHTTKKNKAKTQHNMCWTPHASTHKQHKQDMRLPIKKPEEKTNRTSFVCGNQKEHHNTELRT